MKEGNFVNLNERILAEKTQETENIIKRYLPEEKGCQKTVIQAMNYSILAGGKRLRPLLMQETYRMYGGDKKTVEPFMAAIEMIHTYSLVHDDLPAMDNDEYRRGRKTTHAVYGECMAILAGDGLLNLAFETALKAFEAEPDNPNLPSALAVLANKSGIYGMIGGQTADIEAERSRLNLQDSHLLFIHEHKTAALIQAAMMIGALLAGAEKTEVDRMEKCAYNIGVAFQIQDDILDVEGDPGLLGKSTGSDEKNQKQTYVSIHGLKKAGEDAERLSEEAIALLSKGEKRNTFLEDLVRQLIGREK